MTKHKSPNDRRAQILKAAAEEISLHGYGALTMDGIAARTGLSKGSVYRFFGNKKSVALALYSQLFDTFYTLNNEEVLGWNLSTKESLLRLFLKEMDLTGSHENDVRIWFSFLPETVQDDDFRKVKQLGTRRVKQRILNLLRLLLQREGLRLTKAGESEFRLFMDVGNMLIEGVTIERICGTPKAEMEKRVAWILERLVADAIQGVAE
jgi:AcrR family transcriptional regulator